MTAIKPLDQSAETWERRATAAAGDYVKGTDNPRRPWAASTKAAETNYKTAVIDAANKGRFGAGVTKAGDAKWKAGIDRKGAANYQTGVNGAGPDWARGFGPYQTAISQVTLGLRGPKGSAQNYQRSQAIGDTLHKLSQTLTK